MSGTNRKCFKNSPGLSNTIKVLKATHRSCQINYAFVIETNIIKSVSSLHFLYTNMYIHVNTV